MQPIEPERRAQPAQTVPPAPASGRPAPASGRVEPGGSTASLLAGTALVPAAGGPEPARAQAAWRSDCSSERARLTRRPG
jgi:hypothetical protein